MSAGQGRPPRKLSVRRPFTPYEDAALILLLGSAPDVNWETIAERMLGRSARQCRERWVNYLSPAIRSEPWTDAEDQLLINKINEAGHCWANICQCFNGRSENDVKNRWYSHLKYRSLLDPASRALKLLPVDANTLFPDRKKRNRTRAFPQRDARLIIEMRQPRFTAFVGPQEVPPQTEAARPSPPASLLEYSSFENQERTPGLRFPTLAVQDDCGLVIRLNDGEYRRFFGVVLTVRKSGR
jgi:hypothetical protein